MPSFPKSKKPKDILAAYNEGFQGVKLDPNHLDKLLGELPHPLFGAASTYQKGNKTYSLKGTGDNAVVLLYKAVRQFDQTLFEDEAQETGDCSSHGTRNSADLTRAVEIFLYKQAEEWITRGATEMIYKYRGSNTQGMAVSRAVEFINRAGGILLRKNYPDLGIDLSEYNYKIGVSGRSGVSDIILAEGKKHQVKTVSLITSVEEACDALANGYGITCGSNQGFASKRDKDGFASPKGSWSHCMAWGAVDTQYSRPGILIVNSWGCHDDQTEVLTKNGWKKYFDILYSDEIATLNQSTHNMEYHKPDKIHIYDYNDSLLNFKYRGVDLLVTPNHNMYIGKHISKNSKYPNIKDVRNWELKSALECPKIIHTKKDAKWIGAELMHFDVAGYKIPADDWIEFLGYFISEGSTTYRKDLNNKGNKRREYITYVSQKKPKSKKIMSKFFDRFQIPFRETETGWQCNEKELYDILSKLGKCNEKGIPEEILMASSRQLEILYNALMLGDGSYSKGRRIETQSVAVMVKRKNAVKITYYTSSKKLADQFQELCLKTGRAGDISTTDRTEKLNSKGYRYNHKEYSVRIKEKSLTPRSKSEYPEKIKYNGKVWCLTVPNHVFYVRRNGKACWSGNSWNTGPKRHEQPEGSFWIDLDVAADMIKSRSCWAVSNFDGFPAQKLTDYGTLSVLD